MSGYWKPILRKQAQKWYVTEINEKGEALITAGLKGNERIIKAGVNALQENEKVRVINEDSRTNIGGLI